MLLAQEPKLLLVDEPVAGMTDAETQQTAELLKEINRDRTVVVVEHDMAFVRELGVKVTACTKARCSPKARSTRSRPTSAWSKCIWGGRRMRMLDVNAIDLHYGAAQALRARLAQGRAGQGHLRARPQRRRQDEPAATRSSASIRSRAAPSPGTATTSPRCGPSSAPGAASPTCRRAARSSRC